jgi:hypothetical protein
VLQPQKMMQRDVHARIELTAYTLRSCLGRVALCQFVWGHSNQ